MFWGKKKAALDPLPDLSLIGVDLHSHLLPGIDDGSQDMDDTVDLLTGLKELGYHKVITTPHNQADFFENPGEKILAKLDQVRNHIAKIGLDIEIEAASEYYLDYKFRDRIKNKDLLTFGDNYVLFELSPTLKPMNFETIIFEMQMAGYRPVMAHPERYGYFHGKGQYEELTDKGILLQVNISSLSPFISNPVRKAAETLIANEHVTFAGSDTHSIQNIHILKNLLGNPHLVNLVRSGRLFNHTL
jgi:tyrosine-protein phosphatase YwqE